jgi:Zn-dependent protease with chaperone function
MKARYADGKSSIVLDVHLKIFRSKLVFWEGEPEPVPGQSVKSWKFDDMIVSHDWTDGLGGTFSLKDDTDAGLTVFDLKLFDAVRLRLGLKDQATYLIPVHGKALAVLMVAAALFVVAFFPAFHAASRHIAGAVPQSWDNSLGDVALAGIQEDWPVCKDEDAEKLLGKITARLERGNTVRQVSPKIHILKSREANAFALPGNHMVVLSGFLKKTKSENEIAGVLAHEIGHMVHRDPLESFIEAQGIGVVTSLISGSGSAYGDMAKAASMLQILSYSRDKELVADRFAVGVLERTGYTADGLGAFLLEIDGPEAHGKTLDIPKSLTFLSTHPETEERISILKKIAKKTGEYRPSLIATEFSRLQNVCSEKKETK